MTSDGELSGVQEHGLRDSELVRWKPDDRDTIERTLASLCGITRVVDGKATTTDLFRHDALLYIIGSLVEAPGITDLAKRRAIVQSWRRVPLLKRPDADTFRRVLAAAIRRYLAQPEQLFHLVFPLNIHSRSIAHRKSITVQGQRFMVRSWADIQRRLAFDTWMQDAELQLSVGITQLVRNFTPLEVMCHARDHDAAFGPAYSAFELLRCVLNRECMYTYTIQMGFPAPLGKVLPPPTYGVFGQSGMHEAPYAETETPRKYGRPSPSGEQVEHGLKLLREITRARDASATLSLLEDALRKYGRAMDTTDRRAAFLSLWQILEALTHNPSTRYNISDVCKRVRLLLQHDVLMKDVLACCYEARNALVHRGQFAEDGLREVGMLKAVVDHSIAAVYRLRHLCPDRPTLFMYYDHAGAPTGELAAKGRVIAAIRRQKRRS